MDALFWSPGFANGVPPPLPAVPPVEVVPPVVELVPPVVELVPPVVELVPPVVELVPPVVELVPPVVELVPPVVELVPPVVEVEPPFEPLEPPEEAPPLPWPLTPGEAQLASPAAQGGLLDEEQLASVKTVNKQVLKRMSVDPGMNSPDSALTARAVRAGLIVSWIG